MNSKHKRVLNAIFTDPVPAGIEWNDIENLLTAVGCKTVEGNGSRVRFVFGDEVETFHRPHPAKEAKRYQVRDARQFLMRIGVRS